MDELTYRKVILFANNGGALSWRYLNDIKLSIGEEVELGYYICSKCRGLHAIHEEIDRMLKPCKFCSTSV